LARTEWVWGVSTPSSVLKKVEEVEGMDFSQKTWDFYLKLGFLNVFEHFLKRYQEKTDF